MCRNQWAENHRGSTIGLNKRKCFVFGLYLKIILIILLKKFSL